MDGKDPGMLVRGGGSKNGYPRSMNHPSGKMARASAEVHVTTNSPSHLVHGGGTQPQPGRTIRGQIVIALYTYQGSEHGDMSFQKGDKMEIIDDTYESLALYTF